MNNPIFKTSLFLILFNCLNLNAYSDEQDIVRYALDYRDLVVMGLYDYQYSGKIEIPYSVTSEKTGKSYNVTRINKGAFHTCHISEISLPGIEIIEDDAFEYCYYLENVYIGARCWKIGDGIFGGAPNAKAIIDERNIYYDSRNGCNAIIETSTNKLIAGSSKSTIPEGVECLGRHSFFDVDLESVTIPKSVKEIEEEAFFDNDMCLREVYVAATEPPAIYQESFTRSSALNGPMPYEYVTLYVPKGCIEKYQNHYIWGQFKRIEEIETGLSPDPDPEPTPDPEPEPQGKTFVEDVDNSEKEVTILFIVNEGSSSLAPTVTIANDTGVSGQFEIPATVKHNGVEYKVTEIAEGAFVTNTVLTDITIPASITSIGDNAFNGCANLKSITIYNPTPINLSAVNARGFTRGDGSSVFVGVDKATCILYVPEGSVDAYKAAPVWSEFKNILPIKTSTGINGIDYNGEAFDVFTISGQKVKSKVTSLDGLPNGIYIVNGKKVMKK